MSIDNEYDYFKAYYNNAVVNIQNEISVSEKNITKEEVRVIREGKIGSACAFGKNMGMEKLSKNIGHWEKNIIDFPGNINISCLNNRDDYLKNISYSEMYDIGLQLMEKLKHLDNRFSYELDIIKTRIIKEYVNSKGLSLGYSKSLLGVEIRSSRRSSNLNLKISNKYISSTSFNYTSLANSLIEVQYYPQGIVEVFPGEKVVILTNQALLGILIPLRKYLNSNNSSAEILNNENSAVSKKITIIDDPTVEGYENSYPFDDEGIASMSKALISDGRIVSIINDLYNSSRLKVLPTGNGIRTINNERIIPRFSNFIVEKGEKSLEQVIKDIDDGIIVNEIIGNGISNFSDGSFVFSVNNGYGIVNGKIRGRIRPLIIKGNIFQALKNISVIGDKINYIHNGIYSPFIVFEKSIRLYV
ncbi:putative Zn-dependent protease [Anaerobacterium chartisolvens]|uniref:Putative Zn-dependent protease n=1 Tax=Anaerobacterium chartisolvens TaxID=1297424 RepID=A0A369AW76_9FIRM|nr:metallopeptidase TldD-related protein [Anaerobacterium chartisolvens]RCX12506.1 putative Zn-dependent protease [Anaerobacterium chartisolvens]